MPPSNKRDNHCQIILWIVSKLIKLNKHFASRKKNKFKSRSFFRWASAIEREVKVLCLINKWIFVQLCTVHAKVININRPELWSICLMSSLVQTPVFFFLSFYKIACEYLTGSVKLVQYFGVAYKMKNDVIMSIK